MSMNTISKDSHYKLTSGTQIPLIGFGVYLVPPLLTANLVYQALKAGYRLIDTAQIYRNESEVGEGVLRWISENPESNKREDIFIITKIWDSFHGYESAKQSIKASIKKICVPGIDYIDLFLIHSPNSNKQKRLETYQALQESKDSNYVHSIGVSNYGINHLEELYNWKDLKYPPVSNQIEIHPWLMRSQLVDYCSRRQIICQAYSPLAKGRKFNDLTLNSIAKKYEKNNAQILIRWSVQKGFVVLPKTLQIDRLKSNFNIWDFELSNEDILSLEHEESYFITGWDPTLYNG
ncbi:hypothetical protein DASC09_047760 [Saccharomycopsis crataegensis]|uniref:NADP-dependent oxidoreductase domain-containing protein n=1 Tax=Saccharomycopsis crataegensis TaxID=43959 RepID=A0AAV5QRU6_9ASCO|nr:hypothetical protein DASC09_047760 [Saccharomycopsis crataegensis]